MVYDGAAMAFTAMAHATEWVPAAQVAEIIALLDAAAR